MSLKSIVCKLKWMKNGLGSISKSVETKHTLCRTKSHVALDVTPTEPVQQGQWASLPPELLLDIIRRVEESETSWPARAIVVCCASVCKSWRSITLEIVKTPQQCGTLTFPISLKQVMNSSPTFWSDTNYSYCSVFYVLFLLCVWLARSQWLSDTVLY